MSSAVATGTARLIVVYRGDPSGRYAWLSQRRPDDVTVTFDPLAAGDLDAREPLLFDDLQSWEERSASEHHVDRLLSSIRAQRAVAEIGLGGHRLIDFVAFRLREELVRLLRGWDLAHTAPGARELVCDPAAPAALVMGAQAALGMNPAVIPYTLPPALPGSHLKRMAARPVMRAVALRSRPQGVRVAAVATGKLMLALAALPDGDLREAGVGTMPFPGLDHGNSALLALRRRLPMLATFGPRRGRAWPVARLPDCLEVAREPELDRALSVLVARLLAAAAAELDCAVSATAALERARGLRALLLPSAAYGASRVLIDWAHRHDVRVGAMQHGIYAFREFHGEDQRADVVFCWGEGTAEQAQDWPEPRPQLLLVGAPGTPTAPPRPPLAAPRRALITSSYGMETPITPVAFGEAFMDAVIPGLAKLARAGVQLELRPHPNEDPERYRRLLARHGLAIEIVSEGPFAAAAGRADIVISSASSVAFEAAALGLPILLWHGGAPPWVFAEHFVAPWTQSVPGMFGGVEDFGELIEELIARPAQALGVAHELRRRLARYAQPFDPVRFGDALRMLAG
jgi:hypothetical protein